MKNLGCLRFVGTIPSVHLQPEHFRITAFSNCTGLMSISVLPLLLSQDIGFALLITQLIVDTRATCRINTLPCCLYLFMHCISCAQLLDLH